MCFVWKVILDLQIHILIFFWSNTLRPQIENSDSHHEDSSSFTGKFYKDRKALYQILPVNSFMLKNELICKVNDPSTDLP